MGAELAELRRSAGLSQRDLARLAGYATKMTVSKVECGYIGSPVIIERLVNVVARHLREPAEDILERLFKLGDIEAPVSPSKTGFRNPFRACDGVGFDLFYDEPLRAVELCRTRCVVMEGCLRYAVSAGEEHGVWGGCTEVERTDLAELWDGEAPLVVECQSCERGFVPLLDGDGALCVDCR